MRILGFNCYLNDSAAALFEGGGVLGAVEEERFTRRKHTGVFPEQAIHWCLDAHSTTLADLDAVTFNMRPFLGLPQRLWQIALGLPRSLAFSSNQGAKWLEMVRVEETFRRTLNPQNAPSRYAFHLLPHHICHAASAFYPSPFEEAAILVWDGSGEIASTMLAHGRDRQIVPLDTIDFPHSVGYLYSAVTQFLGFEVHEGEGKVMGLASYGDERFFDLFETMFRLLPGGRFKLDLSWFNFQRGSRTFYSPKFVRQFGPPRTPESPLTEHHHAIAAGVQHALECIGFHLLRELRARTGSRKLVIAGGVGLNGLFNGKLLQEETGFDGLFVQPASHDAGGALGGPLYVWHHLHGGARVAWRNHALLGPSFSDEACEAALQSAGLSYERLADPAEAAGQSLAKEHIIGWFQGRAEYGPRALGCRSILADPRRAEMKDIVNARVKFRESFRPFAPAILAEYQGDYFTCAYPSEHMLQIYPVHEDMRAVIPAVTHVDGTGRVQSVDREVNPPYRRLIESFHRATGVPVILNTSFNVRGEPIVNTPEQAIYCFLHTDLDELYLGPFRSIKRRG